MVCRVVLCLLVAILFSGRSNSLAGMSTAIAYNVLTEPVPSDVVYVYDELGRLVAVVDPAGDTAVYSYDAVGNLLSISRHSSSTVAVIEFTPNSGVVGASVTIYGTSFSSTPSQNAVTFNGVAASVTSATANQIVTSVPAGATSGTIAVISPSGSASSSTSFVVTGSGSATPSITGFSPTVAAPGSSVTVSGSNFDPIPTNNISKVNLTFAAIASSSPSSMTLNPPATTSGGHISVTTPTGNAVSSGDLFVPPSPYAAADVVFTGRTAFGASNPVTIGTGNKIGMLLFDGTAGQRVSLKISSRTIGHSKVAIHKPDATVHSTGSYYSGQGDIFVEPTTLPISGTYMVFAGSLDGTTGGMTLTVYDVPADSTAPIAVGGSPVTVSLTPGQNAALPFSGVAGQRLGLNASSVTITGSTISIKKPDGTFLIQSGVGVGGAFLETNQLTVAGDYTVGVDPSSSNTGNMTLALTDISDVTGTMTPGGSPLALTTTTAGQNIRVGFTGAASQRISLKVNPTQACTVTMYKPDGTVLATTSSPANGTGFVEPTALPVAGNYSILVDISGTAIGSATLTLYDMPADVTGTISIGGAAEVVTITTPGQNAALTFSGVVGQRVGLNASSVTITGSTVSIKKPDGTNLISSGVGVGGAFLETSAMTVAGTYTLVVDPSTSNTGNMTLALTDISDVTGTITIGGAAQSVTLIRGQNGLLSFSGSSGQQVTVHMTSNTITSLTVKLRKPDGTVLTSSTSSLSSFNLAIQTLPADGTYTILVDPSSSNIGSVSVSVTSP